MTARFFKNKERALLELKPCKRLCASIYKVRAPRIFEQTAPPSLF